MSQAEFCRRHEIKGVTFAWWKRKLTLGAGGVQGCRGSRGSRGRRAKPGSFAEIPWTVPATRPAYEGILAFGRVVRLPADFDAGAVSRLIVAVEGAG